MQHFCYLKYYSIYRTFTQRNEYKSIHCGKTIRVLLFHHCRYSSDCHCWIDVGRHPNDVVHWCVTQRAWSTAPVLDTGNKTFSRECALRFTTSSPYDTTRCTHRRRYEGAVLARGHQQSQWAMSGYQGAPVHDWDCKAWMKLLILISWRKCGFSALPDMFQPLKGCWEVVLCNLDI